jgi:hypothetical protein
MPNSQNKVRNWKDYNQSLKRRGAIIFSFDENYLSQLYYKDPQVRGGARLYDEGMYEFLLTIKVMLRLPWRAAIGFAEGLLMKAFPHEIIDVPNFAHASRECARLELKIKQSIPPRLKGMELAFDSTGVNVYTTSGWHQRKYGKESLCRKRNQWKKIHIAMDLDNQQIMSMEYTDSNVNDCEVMDSLCREIKGNVKSVRADGAYDTEEIYKIIEDWGAQVMIPPARTSKAQDELKQKPKKKKIHLQQRDKIIKEIRKFKDFDEGLKNWKIQSGYHRRSLIESFMFRLKRTFGFYLQHKTDRARKNEIITKINILNLMASYGRAQYSI